MFPHEYRIMATTVAAIKEHGEEFVIIPEKSICTLGTQNVLSIVFLVLAVVVPSLLHTLLKLRIYHVGGTPQISLTTGKTC